mmetsp:Transcript_8426/g.25325  ORF Transcript_8426/g.25325 Transcript_8426/m.25325 type:complete len:187 (+) Transcript_8426:183-743(+)
MSLAVEGAVNASGGAAIGFDVFNEPNSCLFMDPSAPGCGASVWEPPANRSAAMASFLGAWDVAAEVVRSEAPGADLIGPSITDGGVGVEGWGDVFGFLRAFLLHARDGGTVPDVLTWHAMGSLTGEPLEQHHAELRAWALAGVLLDVRRGKTTPSRHHVTRRQRRRSRRCRSAASRTTRSSGRTTR